LAHRRCEHLPALNLLCGRERVDHRIQSPLPEAKFNSALEHSELSGLDCGRSGTGECVHQSRRSEVSHSSNSISNIGLTLDSDCVGKLGFKPGGRLCLKYPLIVIVTLARGFIRVSQGTLTHTL
jgi:hypothetical protein